MNEVEKMYENAGISNIWVEESCEPERHYNSYEEMINNMMKANGWTLMEAQAVAERKCRKEYPPFTAEKQLELIKWLGKNKNGFGLFDDGTEGLSCHCDFHWEWFCKDVYAEDFDNALAGLINSLWQDLTEKERKQIKEILE